jgi:hypothetical protein
MYLTKYEYATSVYDQEGLKKMTDEQKKAFRVVIDYLDKQMQEAPNRELADTSNYLEAELSKEN